MSRVRLTQIPTPSTPGTANTVEIFQDQADACVKSIDSSGVVRTMASHTGTATVNFGSFPGTTDATVVVTGQGGIVSTSIIQVQVALAATGEHSADEHLVDPPQVVAGLIVPGTGFTIYARARENFGPRTVPRVYGRWTITWTWE